MSDYLLSIIIPTKNREEYCLEAVRLALELPYNSVQIVIQNNGDSNSLENQIKIFNAENIKYNYHGGVLSFVDNFSEAVSLADGEYLCMIGDDDCVLPNIIETVEFAKKNDIDAIIPGLNAVYCWQNDKPFIKHGENGYLCLSFIKSLRKEVEPLSAVKDLMRMGGQNYQKCNLPRLYHGIVKRFALERVHDTTGKFFDGLTPDIYMAVALAFVCKKVIRLGYPITISGICPKCGSSDSATGKHTGRWEDAPHFKGHDSYVWDEKVPKIYSVESIWADTALHAVKSFATDDMYSHFRVDILDGFCLYKYPQFKTIIVDHAKNFNYSPLSLSFKKVKFAISSPAKRIFLKIFRKPSSVKKFYDVKTIEEALNITQRYLPTFNDVQAKEK